MDYRNDCITFLIKNALCKFGKRRDKMKVLRVNDLKKVDPTRYLEGDVFLTSKSIGVLHNGKIEQMVKQSDLKEYVKKKDVVKLIEDTMKKVKTDES